MDPPFKRITRTHNSIVIHEPVSTEMIEQIWYAIIAKNKADPTSYEISAYVTGWWSKWDDREHNALFAHHGGAFLVEYPEPLLNFEDGWAQTMWWWLRPMTPKTNPLYQPHMRWSVEFCWQQAHPSYQATPYFPHVVDTRSESLPASLLAVGNTR